MSERGQVPDPEDLERRRNMIQTIGDAISKSDFGFVIDMVSEQKLMRPFEVVAIMDVNQRRTEDEQLSAQWRTGLELYLQVLDIHGEVDKMPPNEAKIIGKIQ